MALQSDISRSDGWFVGEDKRVRFTVYASQQQAAPENITGWSFAYDFYRGTTVAFTIESGADLTITDGPAGEVVVAVDGDLTAALPTLTELHHVLRRTDEGERAVVSYGDVVLIDPAEV